jgi:hypothetical protein
MARPGPVPSVLPSLPEGTVENLSNFYLSWKKGLTVSFIYLLYKL